MLPLALVALAIADAPLTLKDGDRVALVGGTLVEREQRHGWWETALTTRHPGKTIRFRNLGWSGDTVFGHARAGFGSPADGFRDLVKHTRALEPTVILLAYGTNESFDGEPGLPNFTKGLEKLLDELAPAKARVVVLGPMRQGTRPAPFPSPETANKNLRLYADAVREVAKKRKLPYVDLYDLFGDIGKKVPGLSDNGIHFTDAGYRWSAPLLAKALLGEGPPAFVIDASRPAPFPWEQKAGLDVPIVLKNLEPGRYTLSINDKDFVTADAEEWKAGVAPASDKLRQLIVSKNELYFHRWRPQNVTYLFGFRKHEQGKNAREIPQFDPLVAEKEKDIAALNVTADRVYFIAPANRPSPAKGKPR